MSAAASRTRRPRAWSSPSSPVRPATPASTSSPRGPRPGISRPSATSRPAWSTPVPRRPCLPLRVDNEGDWHNKPWNTEQAYLKPGERATVTVIFGHQYGHKPGYRTESEGSGEYPHVHRQGRRREVLPPRIARGRRPGGREAAGRSRLGPHQAQGRRHARPGRNDRPKTQIEAKGAKASAGSGAGGGQSLAVVFPAAKGEQSVALKPPAGRWDLTRCHRGPRQSEEHRRRRRSRPASR